MRRLRKMAQILEFTFRALSLVCQEKKVDVSWYREFKTITFVVSVYNHLFDDEIKRLEEEKVQ